MHRKKHALLLACKVAWLYTPNQLPNEGSAVGHSSAKGDRRHRNQAFVRNLPPASTHDYPSLFRLDGDAVGARRDDRERHVEEQPVLHHTHGLQHLAKQSRREGTGWRHKCGGGCGYDLRVQG